LSDWYNEPVAAKPKAVKVDPQQQQSTTNTTTTTTATSAEKVIEELKVEEKANVNNESTTNASIDNKNDAPSAPVDQQTTAPVNVDEKSAKAEPVAAAAPVVKPTRVRAPPGGKCSIDWF
jgi:hypothetical protein